jgi:hypothetical protein
MSPVKIGVADAKVVVCDLRQSAEMRGKATGEEDAQLLRKFAYFCPRTNYR